MLAALWSIPVCRLAFPGEFTHRAYKSDRFDLAQVEGLRDLIDADTETQQHAPLCVAEVGALLSFLPLYNLTSPCKLRVEFTRCIKTKPNRLVSDGVNLPSITMLMI